MILAGTGHRPPKLGGYGNEAFRQLVGLADHYLRKLGPEKVISGMALGWDQALAQAALNLGIPYIAAIPFIGQEERWVPNARLRYNQLMIRAHEVIPVSEPGYAGWKMQARNAWMVDRCHVLLACWNGSDGGTRNCVEYAKKKGVEVVEIWPSWLPR